MKIKTMVLAVITAIISAMPASAATTADPYYAMPTYGFVMEGGVPCFGKFSYTLPDYWAGQPAEVARLDTYMKEFVAETSAGGTAPFFVWAVDTGNSEQYTMQLGYKPGATTAQISMNTSSAHSLMLEGGVQTWRIISFTVTPQGITAARAGVAISPRTGNQTAALLVFGRCSLADDGIRGLSTADVSGYPSISMYDDGQYFGTLDTPAPSPPPFVPPDISIQLPDYDAQYVPYDPSVLSDDFLPYILNSVGSTTNVAILIFFLGSALFLMVSIIRHYVKRS